jgi:hypothetical protein
VTIKFAINEVVVDAAGASHGEGAQQQPQEQIPPATDSCKRDTPGAGPEEEPDTDWAIDPHQRREGPKPRRKGADNPALFTIRDNLCRVHRFSLAGAFPLLKQRSLERFKVNMTLSTQ